MSDSMIQSIELKHIKEDNSPIYIVKVSYEKEKIDKQGIKILVSCTVGAILLLALCLIMIRLTHPPCELVFIDSQSLENITSNHWQSQEPFLSRDSSLLIRLSAHLEYKFESETESSPNKLDHVEPSSENPERFIVLDLEHLSTNEFSDDRYRLKFNSNCTVITMVMVRNYDLIYVEHIKLELRVSGEPKKICDVVLPLNGAFKVKVGLNGVTHYFCNNSRILRFNCFERVAYKPKQIADLFIHLLEFETKDDRIELRDYKLNFESPVSNCV